MNSITQHEAISICFIFEHRCAIAFERPRASQDGICARRNSSVELKGHFPMNSNRTVVDSPINFFRGMTRYDCLSQWQVLHCNKFFIANTCFLLLNHKNIVTRYVVYRSNTSRNAVGTPGPVGQVILFLWTCNKLIVLCRSRSNQTTLRKKNNQNWSQTKLHGKNKFPF